MVKALFVTLPDRKLPVQPANDGPVERFMRLSFQFQDLPALIPTVVTRDGDATDSFGEVTSVPRQALVVAPLLAIPAATRRSKPATRGHQQDHDSHHDRHHNQHHHHDKQDHGKQHHHQRQPGPSHIRDTTAATVPDPSSILRSVAAVPPPPTHLDVSGLSLPGYAPGYKDRNQDSALLIDAFLSNRQQLFAVMDGHGPEGHLVSTFIRRNLPFTLLSELIDSAGGGQGAERAVPGASALENSSVAHASWNGSAPAARSLPSGSGGGGSAGGPMQRALCRTVAALDEHLARSGIDDDNSGTTAALCHVHGRRLTAAWVGDSRMVLGLPTRGSSGSDSQGSARNRGSSGSGPQQGLTTQQQARQSLERGNGGEPPPSSNRSALSVVPAGGGASSNSRSSNGGDGSAGGASSWRVVWRSQDHKPELPEEAARIEAAGGRVARSVGRQGPDGPFRVWFRDQPFPGLAMSRALGDRPGREIGITASPSCVSLELPDRGPAVLVVASDGVWELLGDEQVLALAAGAGCAAEAASRVVHQSRRAWVREYGGSYIDDITAVVVRFDMPPEPGAGRAQPGTKGA